MTAASAAITNSTIHNNALSAEPTPTMDVPLRPVHTNFYGAFLMPTDAGDPNKMWEGPHFLDAQTVQIDAVKSIRGNLVCSFLDCRWAVSKSRVLTLDIYLSRVRRLADYIASKNMYWLPYCCVSMHSWSDFGLTNAAVIPILISEAKMLSGHPNVIGLVLNDEPFVSDGDISFAPALGAQYRAVKAVVPTDFPITVASNPCGNSASIRGNAMAYSGANKQLFDSIAPYQDFACFNPQAANVASDLAALIAAYPKKQIAFGGANAATDDASVAKRTAALVALVGSNNVRLYSQFAVLDLIREAFGMFNNDYSPRRSRTDAFTIALALAAEHGRTVNP